MRLLWLSIIAIGGLSATLDGDSPSDSQVSAALSDEYRRVLEQLDSDDYTLRQRAEQLLYERGAASIPALEAASANGRTGVLAPALRVLERMLIEGCPDVADAAERALERLAFSEVPDVMGRARVVLAGNQHLRQRRALAAIRELGGRVLFQSLDGSQRGNIVWGWGRDPQLEIPGQDLVVTQVILARDWQGGEAGLWHLTRLEDAWGARLWGMEIFAIRGSGLPIESVQALASRIPHLQVHERGACLGIKSGATGPCQVSEVVPGGAADNAGIQQYDVVRQLNDTPIETFGDLVGNLLNYAPEEKVTLKIERGGQEVSVPVVLGDWHDLNTAAPPPPPTPLFPPFNQR